MVELTKLYGAFSTDHTREAPHLDRRRVVQQNRWYRNRYGLGIEPDFYA